MIIRYPLRFAALTIIVLMALGCERDDASYSNTPLPSDPDSLYQEPLQPKDNPALQRLAASIEGSWKGTLVSDYVDYEGKRWHQTYDAHLDFSRYEKGSINGKGTEVDSLDGKRVWWMRFSWYLGADGVLHTRTDEGGVMASTSLSVTDSSLTLTLEAPDGLETSSYTLSREI